MDSAFAAFPALPSEQGAAPRSVAHLAFPEILVIWALRRYTACRHLPREARTAILAPEFSRALGLARLEDSLAAFVRLADNLASAARLPQALSVLEDDRINPTEEALLATLAALQQGETAQAAALSEWSLLPPGRPGFLAAAGSLARALREAGHKLPYQAPRRCTLSANPQGDSVLPSATAATDLRPGERAVIAALRVWGSAFRSQADALEAARAEFARQFSASGTLWGDPRPGGDAGLSLHAVLRNTTLAATRPVDVRCPACPGVSPDEARLLHAVAWLQRDVAEPARAALGDWLPAAAVRLTLSSARGLGQALLAAELPLPLRGWDFAALAAAAEPGPSGRTQEAEWRAAGGGTAPTLH